MSTAVEQPNEITVADAVKAAVRALPSFIARQADGVRVEEVFPPRGGNGWRITLSHLEPGTHPPSLFPIPEGFRSPPTPERVFHVFEIDNSSGRVLAMRLREDPQ